MYEADERIGNDGADGTGFGDEPRLAWILIDGAGRTIAGFGTDFAVPGYRSAVPPSDGIAAPSAARGMWVSILDLARSARGDVPNSEQAAVAGDERATWLHRILPGAGSEANTPEPRPPVTLTVLTRGFSAGDAAAAERALAACLASGGHARDEASMGNVDLPRVAVHAVAADGGVIATHRADESFAAASTIKLAVAVTVLAAVDRGELELDGELSSRSRFPVRDEPGIEFALAADEADPDFPPDGTSITIRECLAQMIECSSNEATNLLADSIGLDAIAERVSFLCLEYTTMERLIGDYRSRERGLGHVTTARELTALLAAVVDGKALAPATTRVLLDLLRAQRFPAITQGLAHASDAGSKSGWDLGIRNDVAWFAPAGRPEARVTLAVGVEGMESRSAIETIRAVARAVESLR